MQSVVTGGITFAKPLVLHKCKGKDGGVFGWDRIEIVGKMPYSMWTRPAFKSPASRLCKAERHPARTFIDCVWVCIVYSEDRAMLWEFHDDEEWAETIGNEYEIRDGPLTRLTTQEEEGAA